MPNNTDVFLTQVYGDYMTSISEECHKIHPVSEFSIKKSVGILTYHTGYNYGASLQAYALAKIISKMGISCEIINFETERFVASREMFSRKPDRIKELIKIATRIPYYKVLKKRQRLFDEFTNTYLPISEIYRTEDEVIEHAEDYKCIVCGSDQIWNLSQLDAPAANLLFYLNFPKRQRRVSYAASFGIWVKEASQYTDTIVPLLKEFDFISVREQSGVDLLDAFGINCEIALDPTVLLDQEEYEIICRERLIPEPYVLLFSWSCGDEVVKAAKNVASELGLPLISITPPPRLMFSGIRRKLDVGPCEFLSMIKYAEFVVTDSFHGTAFSTNFEKPYISVVSNGKTDPRMESLLKQLGLGDHLVDSMHIDVPKMKGTDFNKITDKKSVIRRESMEFLNKALHGLGEK